MPTMTRRIVASTWLVLLAIFVQFGCGASTYELPPPAEEGERKDVELREDDEGPEKNATMAARAEALELYNLLSTKRYDEAAKKLSRETRQFLTHGREGGGAAEVLADGRMKLPNGSTHQFDPVELLMTSNLDRMKNSIEGVEEHETDRRREFFLIDKDGNPEKIVMILQGDGWVLHKTAIDSPPGAR